MNGTQAYLRVYPSASYETAMVNASRLLRNAKIKEEIDGRLAEFHMSANDALKRQADIAKGDIGDFYDDNLVLDFKRAKQMGLTRLVKRVRQKTTTFIAKKPSEEDREVHEIELEMYPADVAQERILKVHNKIKPDSAYELVIKYANPDDKPTPPA